MNKEMETILNIFRHIKTRHPGLVSEGRPKASLSEQTSIKFFGDFKKTSLTKAVYDAFYESIALDHKLTDEMLMIPGMSGRKFRYFLNNLIPKVDNPRYLEVGCWKGSSVCAAMFKNQLRAICVDNWTQFGGPRDDFIKNTNKAINHNILFELMDEDFRKVKWDSLDKSNVYFYDGPHQEQDQYDGVVLPLPALDENFILMVDDYNLEQVIRGTQNAIKEMKLDVLASIQILTTTDGTGPQLLAEEWSDWHNGYYIAVCQKTM